MSFWKKVKEAFLGEEEIPVSTPLGHAASTAEPKLAIGKSRTELYGTMGSYAGRPIHPLFKGAYGAFAVLNTPSTVCDLIHYLRQQSPAWMGESGNASQEFKLTASPTRGGTTVINYKTLNPECPVQECKFQYRKLSVGQAVELTNLNICPGAVIQSNDVGFVLTLADGSGMEWNERLRLAKTIEAPTALIDLDEQERRYRSGLDSNPNDDLLFMMMFPDLAPYMHPTSMQAWAIWYMHNHDHGLSGNQTFTDGNVKVMMEDMGNGRHRAYVDGPNGHGQFSCGFKDGQAQILTDNGMASFDPSGTLSYCGDDGRSFEIDSNGSIQTNTPLSPSSLTEGFETVEGTRVTERMSSSEQVDTGIYSNSGSDPISGEAGFYSSQSEGVTSTPSPSFDSGSREDNTPLSTSY